MAWLGPVSLLLGAVIIPYVLFGPALETLVLGWLRRASEEPALVATIIALLLASDVVLPIPSSALGVAAGLLLGWLVGAISIWVGLTLGCLVGYAIGRWPGGALVAAVGREESVARLSAVFARRGALTLVLARAVPVAAEASIIAAGAARMRFASFMLATSAANLLVAFAYSCIGALLAIDVTAAAFASTAILALGWWAGRVVTARRRYRD
ncbi:MAG: hypothetical protein A4S12_08720 [Proteobacteria bacterium SG_bin5]|nr:MAG: hypothetical protein A4S12_08720 [Proteobacteria bacterium SG_bin5]